MTGLIIFAGAVLYIVIAAITAAYAEHKNPSLKEDKSSRAVGLLWPFFCCNIPDLFAMFGFLQDNDTLTYQVNHQVACRKGD